MMLNTFNNLFSNLGSNWPIIKKLYLKISAWLFVTRYTFLLMCISLPMLSIIALAVENYTSEIADLFCTTSFEILKVIYGNNEELIMSTSENYRARQIYEIILQGINYIMAASVIILIISISHRNFLSNHTFKKYQIHRDGAVMSDLMFVTTWLSIGAILNLSLMYFGFEGKIYTFISIWLVVNTIFYLLLGIEWCGHSISQRARELKT